MSQDKNVSNFKEYKNISTALRLRHTFVVVDVQVVGSREDGDEGGEARRLALPVHAISARREANKSPTLALVK